SFSQAVHGVRGEHAGARTTGWASRFFDHGQTSVIDIIASRCSDGRDQVRWSLSNAVDNDCLARFHRAARDEDGRGVQAQSCVEHARGDLVTVGDTHQRVSGVRIENVLHGVGNDLTGRQGVEHAAVAHGDAVIDGNGVEFLRYAASFANSVGNDVTDIFQVDVAGNELGIRVGDRDNGLAKVIFLGAGGAPERASTSSLTANGGYFRAQRKHVKRS